MNSIKRLESAIEKIIPKPTILTLDYNPAFDGIRAIAVVLVILSHYFPGKFKFGYLGVDIFFVLSGFLIFSIIFQKLENNTFSFKKFYRNRIRRLFPALIFLLLFCLIFGYLYVPSIYYKSIGLHIFTTGFYIQNFELASELGYFDIERIYKPLLHTWSLSVEEQFYILFPLILYLIYKIRKNLILFSLLLLLYSFFIFTIIFFEHYPEKVYYISFSRFWELGLGIVLAYFIKYNKIQKLNFNLNKKLEICLLTFSFFIAFKFLNNYNPIYLFIYLFIWLILIYIAHFSKKNSIFSTFPLAHLGRISYSLYLWHWTLFSFSILVPIMSYIEFKFGINGLRVFKIFILIPLSLFFSIISYKFIEHPLRKINEFKKIFYILSLLLTISFLGLLIYSKQGLPHRKYKLFSLNIENLDDVLGRYKNKNKNCIKLIKNISGKYPKFDFCLANTIENNYDVLILGDSHSKHLYYGFKQYFGNNLKYIEIGIPGWPATFMPVGTNLNSALKQKKKIKFLFNVLKKIKFKKVLIVTRNILYYKGKDKDIDTHRKFLNCFINKTCNNEKTYIKELVKTIKYLKSIGTSRIYFLFENPVLRFYPLFVALKYKFPFDFLNCNVTTMSFLEFYKSEKDFREHIFIISHKIGFKNLNADPVFCDGKYCYILKNKKSLYYDDDHISKYGAFLVVKFLDNTYNLFQNLTSF